MSERDTFDATLGAIDGLPGVTKSRPATIVTVAPILGNAETFIVQTYQDREEGFTAFVQQVSGQGSVRIVLPPAVTAAIYRQRDSLVKRGRRTRGKERWERMSDQEREATVAKLRRKPA